ncbi:MAG TPA: DCC1-like thiol-disulfide oxidoreductase family protein [Fimbriimonadaceae bacterium]|nr:DCC1-like thiol-disulfide oxidoreductase family protein [Fimbriimonadaceae bacterium]
MDGSDHPIVFFDGHCGLCNRSVDYIVRKDKNHVFQFAPLQGTTAGELFKGRADDELMNSLWLKDEEGMHQKSTAWLRIMGRLGGLQALAGVLWILPRTLRDWCYDFVAKRRYRVFGRSETCRIPTPEERAYFLP